MEVVELFVVHGDGGERGIGPVIGVSICEDVAKNMAKGKAFYGANGTILKGHGIEIDNHIYLLANPVAFQDGVDVHEYRERIRKTAMDKLTPEEKIILGLV